MTPGLKNIGPALCLPGLRPGLRGVFDLGIIELSGKSQHNKDFDTVQNAICIYRACQDSRQRQYTTRLIAGHLPNQPRFLKSIQR